jgi:hypothetical protein
MREWLAKWERMAADGYFDGEPDFDAAMGLFRSHVIAAAPDPPEWDPEVTAWEWVAEMNIRVVRGESPLTEAEFRELAGWYRRHESVLYDPNLRAPLGIDPTDRIARRMGATAFAKRLRTLRARHPELS